MPVREETEQSLRMEGCPSNMTQKEAPCEGVG